jgi:polysaccharide export outer membrane protein
MRTLKTKAGAVLKGCGFIFVAAMLISAPGCASDGVARHRMSQYTPAHEGRDPWAGLDAADKNQARTEQPAVAEVVTAEDPGEDVDSAQTSGAAGDTGRVLRRGDRVLIYLRAIPEPEDLKDVIDDSGRINLPHIGKLNVEGLTTSEAESLIEKKYVEGGIYNSITAILVAQQYEYYVQGEVKRPGKYPLAGEITLIQAVSEAGGLTDYANRRKVEILRGQEVLRFNLGRIESGKQNNPIIQPGDVIKVDRGLW